MDRSGHTGNPFRRAGRQRHEDAGQQPRFPGNTRPAEGHAEGKEPDGLCQGRPCGRRPEGGAEDAARHDIKGQDELAKKLDGLLAAIAKAATE